MIDEVIRFLANLANASTSTQVIPPVFINEEQYSAFKMIIRDASLRRESYVR